MKAKSEFFDALSALVEYATVNGNIIVKQDVVNFFKDIIDDDSKYDAVYSYLLENNIKISDYEYTQKTNTRNSAETAKNTSNSSDEITSNDTNSSSPIKQVTETDEEKMFVDMYLDEVKDLKKVSDSEIDTLVTRVLAKDKAAVNELCEAYLPMVIEISKDYDTSGLRHSDIIAIGNLGLFEAIMFLQNRPANMDTFIADVIRHSIEKAINEEIGASRTFTHITDRANMVSDATSHLAEKLGREATIEEVCEYTNLSEEVVREIMKMSLDAINVVEPK